MSFRLRQFLFDAYESHHSSSFPRKLTTDIPIQIDDQDDNDKINEFCNVFCTIKKKNSFTLEIIGNFPITSEMADLVEIYNGKADPQHGRLIIELNIEQIDVLMDLCEKIRKTTFLGIQYNPAWLTMSSRTISSLYRFVRIIREYKNLNKKGILIKLITLQSVFKSFAA